MSVGQPLAHDSAVQHVSGEALYVDDLPEPVGLLHGAVVLSTMAHGRIRSMDTDDARQVPGFVALLTAADVPGKLDVGPVLPGDPLMAPGVVEYAGQYIAVIAATTRAAAREAARRVKIIYEELPAILTLDDAIAKGATVSPPHTMTRGDAKTALAAAPRRLTGQLRIGGQEHFYLEGQVAMALPLEAGDIRIATSTQHPTEVQKLVAKVLGLAMHNVAVECRRMGGGFGGKESQAAPVACMAALLARHTGQPVKLRLDRDEDMLATGKRHDFRIDYSIGFDEAGNILALESDLYGRCGFSPDLSNAIVDRAMFHSDNGYFLPHARITGHRMKTNTVSNTAFRGFGGPQGMAAMEYMIDDIARATGLDPLDVRRRNLYGGPGRNTTHYHQDVTDNILPEMFDRLEASCDYRRRRAAIDAFNAKSPERKRGLALTPVKFGISFTALHLNQAGALVHIYEDGSVRIAHGGTEMGQGLFIKMAQVAADTLGLTLDRVRFGATATNEVPNTSPTAASAGADLNGKAVEVACLDLRHRLAAFAASHFKVDPASIRFAGNMVMLAERRMAFAELVHLAYMKRIHLSATGYYRTPGIGYDHATARGRPFYYFAYGVSCSEVEIDTFTGEHRVLRTDILHDCGASLNPAIDRGQIEGGFVQGMGWLTSEELWFDSKGRLRTHAPSTYKIPTARDLPPVFNVAIHEGEANREDTIRRSKAVGEPPFMHGISVWLAIKDAICAASPKGARVVLDAPATPECILLALETARATAMAERRPLR